MNKTIDILGVEFIEREDGLYECPDGYNITMDQWKDNIFYGMTMLFIETEKDYSLLYYVLMKTGNI